MLKKTKILSFTFVFFISFLFCERLTAPVVMQKHIRNLSPQEQSLVKADNAFGIKLIKKIVQEEGEKNVFISPLSISMALGMTLNGAAGETRQAMQSTLEYQGLTQEQINQSYLSLIELLGNLDPEVVFRIGNSIWYRAGMDFKQNFINLNRKYFDAKIKSLNFNDPQSVQVINQWVNEQTNGKIPQIIQQINPLDIMFILNAIYFKGTWTYQFDPQLTTEQNFYLPDSTPVICKMMTRDGDFRYLETPEFQAIDLPYGNKDYYTTIILPKPEVNLNNLITQLTPELLSEWFNSFSMAEGTIELPKFELEYEIELPQILSDLGMGVAFDPEAANFTGLYEGPQKAYISGVKHKTYLKVDEEGTEAAAATSVTIGVTSIGPRFHMRVDRPFLFTIRENRSHTILFIGKIIKPELD